MTPLPLDDLSSAYQPRRTGLQLYARGVRGGILAGMAAFAVLFLYDLFRLDPLASPSLLSAAALGRSIDAVPGVETVFRAADAVRFAQGLARYAVLHFCTFAAIGFGAALLFQPGRLAMNALTGAVYGVVTCSLAFYTGIGVLAGGMVATPDWRVVLGANAIAGVIMVANLLGDPHAEPGGPPTPGSRSDAAS